jgi:hypothetical protein
MTKQLPRPRPDRSFAFLALFVAASGFAAVTPTEWQFRQPLEIPAPGLVKVELPAASFDAAQPDLRDLRVVDASGQELAYLLERDYAPRGLEARRLSPRSFNAPVTDGMTQLVMETGSPDLLDAVELETAAPFFLKAAHVEISADGKQWQSLGPAVPLFRQFGAEQLRLDLGRQKAAWVRVTLDNLRTRPVTFAGAKLLPVATPAAPPPLRPLGASLTRREEFSGETLLTLALEGRHVPLAALEFNAADPLFMRRVTVGIREMQGDVARERLVATGTIYRVAVDGAPPRAQLALPVDLVPPGRELLVHIHNGDSPPLALEGVSARQHAVSLLFFAREPGSLQLLSGNPQANPPRYDLAAFAGELRQAAPVTVRPGALAATPDYHPREALAGPPLPDIPLAGAPLDTTKWEDHRAVAITRAGVQELELDPAALAAARPDFADLRLIRNGNQIPYLLEQPGLFRALPLAAVAAPDAQRPAVSRWRVTLPEARLPLRRLVLTSPTPLFQRQIRIYEEFRGSDGGLLRNTVAAGAWSRTPEPGRPTTCAFDLSGSLRTDTLWIETDNGDNPAIELSALQAVYPVVRLIFKTGETDGFTLAVGNPAVGAPRYDLGLVAGKLLTAPRNPATLAAASAPAARHASGLRTGYVFWGALGVVVIALLVVVAKLLPKPPAAP